MGKKYGMQHGRFQPFHITHMEFMKKIISEYGVDKFIMAITNPTPGTSGLSKGDNHRHLKEANPYSFAERKHIIETCIQMDPDISDRAEDIMVIPFPVNSILDEIEQADNPSPEKCKEIFMNQMRDILEELMPYGPERTDELMGYLQSDDMVQYMMIIDEWDEVKKAMFEQVGQKVILDRVPRTTSATEVRTLRAKGEDWERLVPPGTRVAIQDIESARAQITGQEIGAKTFGRNNINEQNKVLLKIKRQMEKTKEDERLLEE